MSVLQAAVAFAQRRLPRAVIIELQKLHYPRHIRQFSEPDVAIVRKLVSAGDTAVDAGAHVGWYTNVLSQCVGDRGAVYSFEPIPATFGILKHCVRRLGLSNVRAHNAGVSSVDRKTVMFVPKQAGALNFYRSQVAPDGPVENALKIPVELRSLDSVFANSNDRVSFIKVDVEGHELEAMTGALGLLKRCSPALFIEVSGDPDVPSSPAHRLCELLAPLGYSPWWYDGARVRARAAGDKQINYFFLTDSHVARLRDAGVTVL